MTINNERIAGIDYGSVRIGIALADTEVRIATPHGTLVRKTPALDAAYFQCLAVDNKIDRFVVGLPIHLDGTESAKSREARLFGAWLGEVTGVTVEFFDERFTTTEAEQVLAYAQFTKKQRQARRDQIAAQIMLTAYLESGGHGGEVPRAID
jgi:putative Holliday junction resolvase